MIAWRKKRLDRLDGKALDRIVVKRAYPTRGTSDRTIERPWRGLQLETITHAYFGTDALQVCAIVAH